MTKYGRPFTTYNIIYNGSIVGQLSSSSSIAHRMKTNDIELLTGFLSAMFSIGLTKTHWMQIKEKRRNF